ncbi:hypothetical protein FQZ97_827540 [compost metagenome]
MPVASGGAFVGVANQRFADRHVQPLRPELPHESVAQAVESQPQFAEPAQVQVALVQVPIAEVPLGRVRAGKLVLDNVQSLEQRGTFISGRFFSSPGDKVLEPDL